MFICHLKGAVVEANDRSMQVKIRVNSNRVPQVCRETKAFGQEHEGTRQDIVKLPMPIPILSVLVIIGGIIWPRTVDLFHDPIKQVADHSGSGERGVRRAREDIL